jgi:LacI family transcriptional regulator
MKRPTLRQIGQKAGVSHVTVSLALRNHPSISAETRERLQKLAASFGYQPKPLVAAAMAQMREGFPVAHRATLALLVFLYQRLEALQPFMQWIRGIQQRADQLGYGLDRFNLCDHPTSPGALAKILHSRNILGVVILNPVEGVWRLELDPFLAHYPAAVAGWYPSDMPGYHASQNDLFGTGLLLFGECYKAGYRRIGMVIEGGVNILTRQRLELAFLAARESRPDNFPIPVFTNWDEEKLFSAWLDQHRPDCLIVTEIEIRTWIERHHSVQARAVGLVHWNLYSEIGDWSGADQNNIEVGMSAVDLVVGQIHRGERGLPAHAKRILMTSTWHEGATMRRAPQTTEHHKSWLRNYPCPMTASPRRWRTIDLRDHVNRNPESPGEWFGTLPLLHWGSGKKEIHGVPFDLIDPHKNQGRSVILFGPKVVDSSNPGLVGQEQTIEIPVGFSAGEI